MCPLLTQKSIYMCKNLRALSLNGVENIDINYFTNLAELNLLSENEINHVCLPNLRKMSLFFCQDIDINECANLEELTIFMTRIEQN